MLKRLKFWEDRNNNTGCGVMTTNRIAPEINSSDSEVHSDKRQRRKKSKNFVKKIFSRKSPKASPLPRQIHEEEINVLTTTAKHFVCYPYESDSCQETNRPPESSINIASSSSSTNTLDLTDDQKLHWVSADEALEVKECPGSCHWKSRGFESKSANHEEHCGILKCHCSRCCKQLITSGRTNQSRKSVKFEDSAGKEKPSHLEVSDFQTMTSRPLKAEAECKNFWKNPLENYSIRRCSKSKKEKRINNKMLLSIIRSNDEKDLTTASVSRCSGPTFIDEDLCLELQMSLNINVNNPKKDLKCPSEAIEEMNLLSLCRRLPYFDASRNYKAFEKEALMKRLSTDLALGHFNHVTSKERLCLNCQKNLIRKSAQECPTAGDRSISNCYKTLPNKSVSFSFPVFYENQTTVDDSCVKKIRFENEILRNVEPSGITDIRPLKSSDSFHYNGNNDFPLRVDNALYHAADCEIGKNFTEGDASNDLREPSKRGLNEKLEGSLNERSSAKEYAGHALCKCLHFVAYDNKLYQATSKASTNDSSHIQLEAPVPTNLQKCILHTEGANKKYVCNHGRSADHQNHLRFSPDADGKKFSCVKESEEPVDNPVQSCDINHQSIACAQTKNQEFQSCAEVQEDLSKCTWFWKNMTVDEAEDHLVGLPDGAFLVRNSSDAEHVASVSFRSCGVTHHTRIEHFQGSYSFHSTSLSHGKTTSILQFLEKVIQSSSDPSCIHYLKPKSPTSLAAPVLLLFPLLKCNMT